MTVWECTKQALIERRGMTDQEAEDHLSAQCARDPNGAFSAKHTHIVAGLEECAIKILGGGYDSRIFGSMLTKEKQ